MRVSFFNMPVEVRDELKESLAECTQAKSVAVDFVMLFTKSRVELEKEFPRLAKSLTPAGMLWVSWPKKSSKLASDVDENIIRETGLGVGLVDVKVCAISEIWSGLKFVRRLKDR